MCSDHFEEQGYIMRLIKTKDYEELSRRAAYLLAAQIWLTPDCVLGLATGSTPIGIYRQLVSLYQQGDLDFSSVTTVNLDEYKGLDKENEQSYTYYMHQQLFDHVNLEPCRTHLPDGMNPDAASAGSVYEELIKSVGRQDIQLLGLGHNGHIGFNEPADQFEPATHLVDLSRRTIEANKRFFASADEVPRQAYTMGIGTILQARKILLVVSGRDKAEILQQVLFGPVTPRVPGSVLQLHPDVTVVADEAAFSAVSV